MPRSLRPTLALLLAITLAVMLLAVDARSLKSRHSSLDALASDSTPALSDALRAAHSHRFMLALESHARHLEHSADTMLLQAEAVERHASEAERRERGEEESTAKEEEEEAYTEDGSFSDESELSSNSDAASLSELDSHVALGLSLRLDDAAIEWVQRLQHGGGDSENDGLSWASPLLSRAARELNPADPRAFYSFLVLAAANYTALAQVESLMSSEEARSIPPEVMASEALRAALEEVASPQSVVHLQLISSARSYAAQTEGVDPDSPPSPSIEGQAPQQQVPQPSAEWMESIVAGTIQSLDSGSGGGELGKQLASVAETQALSPPTEGATATSTDELASSILSPDALAHADDNELEARVRTQARKALWQGVVARAREDCARKIARGQPCDPAGFMAKVHEGEQAIAEGNVPPSFEKQPDDPIPLSPSLEVQRGKDTSPESVADLRWSISPPNKGSAKVRGSDPWFNLSPPHARSKKTLRARTRIVSDLLDAEGDRCGSHRCNGHGQCVMNLALGAVSASPSGRRNTHPFHCLCDAGYVGAQCQIKLDQHLRWLLTKGAEPLPKCCPLCSGQRTVPGKWEELPSYTNPFASFAPQCLPYPRVSLYSRSAGGEFASTEALHGRRPDPSCSAPLGELAREDPLVAFELAVDLSAAQGILDSSLLEDMAHLSESEGHRAAMSAAQASAHAGRLRHASGLLKDASLSAQKAAAALAAKLHVSDLGSVKFSAIDLARLERESRELPKQTEECCVFCDLPPLPSSADLASKQPAAQTGPDAILNKDPLLDTPQESIYRRMAKRRKERRHAKLAGETPKADQACCVMCPYHFREVERLTEAAHIRAHGTPLQRQSEESASAAAAQPTAFLEVSVEAGADDRRARHEPVPCCAACPSQFLIAHAFPDGPFGTQTAPTP